MTAHKKKNPYFHSPLSSMLLLLMLLRCSHGVMEQQRLDSAEVAALAEVAGGLSDEPGSSFLSSWEFGPSAAFSACSSFSGVVCEDGHVVVLNLGNNGASLRGKLSPSLAKLTMLRQLTLVPGNVGGRLPDALGRLTALQFVALAHNRLHGCIPAPAGDGLVQLEVLDLSGNRLQCTVPPGLGRLPALQVLDLSNNRLTGSLPPTFFSDSASVPSSALLHLDLSGNLFTGELPATLPPGLEYIAMSGNALSGTLAPLATLRRLVSVDLSSNRLSGPIPGELLTDNGELQSLLLQRNYLSGALSIEAGKTVLIGRLDLSFNELSGTIPAALAGVGSSLLLNNNRFTGQVPAEFAARSNNGHRSVYLQHNFLTNFPSGGGGSVCLQYNCLTPPSESVCPLDAGKAASRPTSECNKLNNNND